MEHYKYLGVYVDADLTALSSFQRINTRIMKQRSTMAKLLQAAPLRLKINLYVTYALPLLLMLPVFLLQASNRKMDQLK